MIRAVLDTNVLASGILGLGHSSAPPAEILRRWEMGAFGLVSSDHILKELVRTLGNSCFSSRIPAADVAGMVETIQRSGEVVELSDFVSGMATHPEDDLTLAAAVSAQVDYLVTGDGQLLDLERIEDVEIVSPRAFVDILDATNNGTIA